MKLSELTPQDKNKLAAELDKDFFILDAITKNYLSYDTLIPLIQKQEDYIKLKVEDSIFHLKCVYDASPSQLLDALFIATGKATNVN